MHMYTLRKMAIAKYSGPLTGLRKYLADKLVPPVEEDKRHKRVREENR